MTRRKKNSADQQQRREADDVSVFCTLSVKYFIDPFNVSSDVIKVLNQIRAVFKRANKVFTSLYLFFVSDVVGVSVERVSVELGAILRRTNKVFSQINFVDTASSD